MSVYLIRLLKAFALVTFDNNDNTLFEEFDVHMSADESEAAFKLNVKPINAIMRNLKKVVSLSIYTENGPDGHNKIVFKMTNETEMTRTNKFNYQDEEIVSASFDEEASSGLKIEPKVFSKLLEHLHQTNGEIEVLASLNLFRVKSFHHDQVIDYAKTCVLHSITLNTGSNPE